MATDAEILDRIRDIYYQSYVAVLEITPTRFASLWTAMTDEEKQKVVDLFIKRDARGFLDEWWEKAKAVAEELADTKRTEWQTDADITIQDIGDLLRRI